MYLASTISSTTKFYIPKDLKSFGETLKHLRKMAGLSQQALVERLNEIHARTELGILPIEPQLISKWETAYNHRGRQWSPSRDHMFYLIEVFADHLTKGNAISWAIQAGHQLVERDLGAIIPPELDWPPVQALQLPSYHVRRRSLEALILEKINKEQVQTLVLWGAGGAGKTTLTIWMAKLLANRFPDGVIWVPIQTEDTIIDIQNSIAESLGFTLTDDSSAKRSRKLHSRLRKKQCLLVLDDISALLDLAELRLGSETCRLLCTTRDVKVASILEAPSIPIRGLTETEGLDLLANWTGRRVAAEELVTRLGGLPLALKLAGGQLRAGASLSELLSAFREEHVDLSVLDMDDAQTRAESLSLCFDLSYRHLSPTARRQFAQLGYFSRDSFEEAAIRVVWGVTLKEARTTLRQLQRFALLERTGRTFHLHPLLHDYARQKRSNASTDDRVVRRRHSIWHIRHVLYHPGINFDDSAQIPDVNQSWADVIAGVKWATSNDPKLASQAALLAHTERSALIEEIGPPLTEAVEGYLLKTTDRVEQVVLHELLGDLHLLQSNFEEGLTHFEQSSMLWQMMKNGLASSRAKLRVAGAYLLHQEQEAAAEAARQAQTILQQSMPLSDDDKVQAERLFYWFNMVYNPLVRWEYLPEEDVIALTHLAKQTNKPVLQARSLHIHRLWCTTQAVSRPSNVKQRGRQLALEAYSLWRASDRKDRADDEVSLTNYLLTHRYGQHTAIRFARRRSQTTPKINSSQLDLVQNEGLRWWLEANESQRISWLSWMLPRYLGADNRPRHPAQGTQLPSLKPDNLGFRSVEQILGIGILGNEGRRLPLQTQRPPHHLLCEPEWRVLSGHRAFAPVESESQELIRIYLEYLEAGYSSVSGAATQHQGHEWKEKRLYPGRGNGLSASL